LPSSSSPRPRKAVTYTLERDGNGVERKYWTLFARDEFPSYEAVWREYIVPLTMRPDHPNFESDEALAKMGRGPEDMGNAQLHYTTFTHLTRVFDLKEAGFSTADQFIEALVRLAAATDVADELLQRATNPSKYAPWSEKDGREARNDWRKAHGYPLREIRGYRNRLLHGHLMPYQQVMELGHFGEGVGAPSDRRVLRFPLMGRETDYLDWRTLFRLTGLADLQDFAKAEDIVGDAWTKTLAYFEQEWRRTLLPSL
jgi:hypothetical protein